MHAASPTAPRAPPPATPASHPRRHDALRRPTATPRADAARRRERQCGRARGPLPTAATQDGAAQPSVQAAGDGAARSGAGEPAVASERTFSFDGATPLAAHLAQQPLDSPELQEALERASSSDSDDELLLSSSEPAPEDDEAPGGAAPLPVGEVPPAEEMQPSNPPAFLDTRGITVHVRGVTKTYVSKGRTYRALDDINLDIEAGSLVALLGPSGSGKTTLLRMIAGLDTVSQGSIRFDDEDVAELPVQARGVGFMFQSFALFRHMTVGENIAFGPRIRRQDVDLERRVLELLQLVDLRGYGSRFPRQLSGGQRQRVALARALAVNPRILLLDEPFGALDPEVKREVRRGVSEIIRRVGLTSILVTHDRDEAFDIADKIVIFNRGKIQQIGSAQDIQERPATPFVASFVEDINKLPATCQFVRRMGLRTHKAKVICRPALVKVACEPPPFLRGQPDAPPYSPATVLDRKDVGNVMKYWVAFDDGVEMQVHVRGLRGERSVDLDLQQRVYLRAETDSFLPFFDEEVESYPLPIANEEVSMQSAQL